MKNSCWPLVISIFLCLFACGSFSIDNFHQAFPIVEPDPAHTKLRLSREGLEVIRRITTPIAVVAVIGPYHSGKSFLLNQLLSLPWMWVWGTPVEVDIDGVKTSVLYLDTEGFESIKQSHVYDDRIFALATILSSVLIYNLPETVREADIARLSFAVELAEEFYGRVKGLDGAFELAKLMWLIQCDFLQGQSVQEMVDEALQPVPNNSGDKNVDRVNQIRDSLAVMGNSSTAFSLPQPHLQRTKLCDMKDDELEAVYVKKRDQFKEHITSVIRPKIVQGKRLNGKEFVSFLEQILEALNEGEIPSTNSLVEVFNRGILEQCLKLYSNRMAKTILPLLEQSLQKIHDDSREEAIKFFDKQRFGRHHVNRSVGELQEEIKKVYKNYMLANENHSMKLCEALYTSCEDKMDQHQGRIFPSLAKFNSEFYRCNQSLERECFGPSKTTYRHRMMKMVAKSKALFVIDYNRKLFYGLEFFFFVVVLPVQFIRGFDTIKKAAFILPVIFEICTKLLYTPESIYQTPVWDFIVKSWETLAYFLDFERLAVLLVIAVVLLVYWLWFVKKKRDCSGLLPLFKKQEDQRRTD